MDQNLYLVQAILYSGKSFTVWKFQDFSVTQILCEINFGESKSSKTAGFAFFEALDSVHLVDFTFPKL